MTGRRVAMALALVLAGVSRAHPAGRAMTLEDLLGYRTIDELRVSPDGRLAVVRVTEAILEENRLESDLHLVPLDGGTVRRLTTTPGQERSPRFSPDGTLVGFIAARGGPAQVFALPLGGGEARALTAHPSGVAGFDWSPDGGRILYVAEAGEGLEETARRERGDDAWTLGRQWRNQRLFIAPAGTGGAGRAGGAATPPSPATGGAWHVREDAAWSADGRRIAWIATPTAELDAAEEARLQVLDVAGGTVADVPGSDRASAFAWAGAGEGLLLVRPFDGRGWSREDLHLWEPGGGPARNLSAHLDRDVEAVRMARGGMAAHALHSRGAVHEVAVIPLRDGRGGGSVWRPGYPVGAVEAAASGWVHVRADRPDEVWIAGTAGGARRLTRFNAEIETRLGLPRIAVVSWPADGRTIEGILTGPGGGPGATAGDGDGGASAGPAERMPLLVRPHGGPRWHTGARFDPLNAWFAAQGYRILEPNFRGSTGYGDAFAKANGGDWGDGPFRDTMAGVDALIDRGLADPARLFLYGWSYGGIMANWAATHTDRFRAIVSGAGVADLRMQYVLSDARRWRFDYFGGSPFTGHRPAYEKDSPVTHVGAAIAGGGEGGGGEGAADGRRGRTPVLFIQGEADDRCPMPQALMMHRALLDAGHVSELIVYPREGHGFREPRHILDRARRIAGWLAAHGPGPRPREAAGAAGGGERRAP